MFIFGYILAILIGYVTLEILDRKERFFALDTKIWMSIGVGLSVCALLTFLTFLLFGSFKPFFIILLPSLLLITAFALQAVDAKKILSLLKMPSLTKLQMAVTALFIIAFGLLIAIANQHPYGEWDGWGLWNLKTKFLILSQTPLDDILHKLNYHTHPDYPLMLPFINTWIYAFYQKTLLPIPYTTSILLSISCGMLLYSGLKQFIDKKFAACAGLVLLTNPYYAFLSTAQYADILLAFLLLACFIVLTTAIGRQKTSHLPLLGALSGLLTFVKNEGLVLSVIILTVACLCLLVQKQKKHVLGLLAGFAVTAAAGLYFKLFLAPSESDIQLSFKALDTQRLIVLKDYLIKEYIDKRWCAVWILASLLILFKLPALKRAECAAMMICLFLYFGFVVYVYASTVHIDLHWWIKFSLRRICMAILPATFYLAFYMHFLKRPPQPPK